MSKTHLDDLISCKTNQVYMGQQFSRLTVIGAGRDARRAYYAVCNCSCGRENLVIQIGSLRCGGTKSCGCETQERMTTHALSGNPVFHRWQGMMRRCYSAEHISYPNYGGRGITVCERWHDPVNFVEDMQAGFSQELELDREDNDRNYEPGNCRWTSRAENAANKRSTLKITFNGETLSISAWSVRLGISRKLLAKRLFERGWSVERAFASQPLTRSESAKLANAASHAKNRMG